MVHDVWRSPALKEPCGGELYVNPVMCFGVSQSKSAWSMIASARRFCASRSCCCFVAEAAVGGAEGAAAAAAAVVTSLGEMEDGATSVVLRAVVAADAVGAVVPAAGAVVDCGDDVLSECATLSAVTGANRARLPIDAGEVVNAAEESSRLPSTGDDIVTTPPSGCGRTSAVLMPLEREANWAWKSSVADADANALEVNDVRRGAGGCMRPSSERVEKMGERCASIGECGLRWDEMHAIAESRRWLE